MPWLSVILVAVKASIALMVFGLGLRADHRDAFFLFRHPGLAVRSFLAMSVIMPLLALSVAVAFRLQPAVKFALVALAMSPVPPLLPRRMTKSGGEAAYAIGLLASASLASIVVIPVSVWAVGQLLGAEYHIAPGLVARVVGATVLAPLVLGIAIRRLGPRVAARMARPTSRAATVVLIVAMIPVLIGAWPDVKELLGNGTLLAIIALALAGVGVGHLLGGPAPEDRPVLALACASRHPAVAMAIATANGRGDPHVVAAILLAVITSALASVPYTSQSKKHTQPRAAGRARGAAPGEAAPSPMAAKGEAGRDRHE